MVVIEMITVDNIIGGYLLAQQFSLLYVPGGFADNYEVVFFWH